MFYNYLVTSKKRLTATLKNSQSGFSLIELLVSISIMVIVMAIVFARQSSFNGAVLLRDEAYSLALQIREIQLNAVSVSGEAGVFRSVLGVYLDSAPAKNGFYNLFKDADSDGFYDTGEEYGVQGILDRRFEIRNIRAGGATTTEMSIIFVRPNFDARFFDSSGEISVTSVEIDIARRGVAGFGNDVLRTVEITSTGQIAVK